MSVQPLLKIEKVTLYNAGFIMAPEELRDKTRIVVPLFNGDKMGDFRERVQGYLRTIPRFGSAIVDKISYLSCTPHANCLLSIKDHELVEGEHWTRGPLYYSLYPASGFSVASDV